MSRAILIAALIVSAPVAASDLPSPFRSALGQRLDAYTADAVKRGVNYNVIADGRQAIIKAATPAEVREFSEELDARSGREEKRP